MTFSAKNQERLYTPENRLPDAESTSSHIDLHPKKLLQNNIANVTHVTKAADLYSVASAAASVPPDVEKLKGKKLAADMVVKYLTPAFHEGRIASKVINLYIVKW